MLSRTSAGYGAAMNTAAAHAADGAGFPVNVLARAALAGTATGARSFTGLAALTLATPPGSVTQPGRSLGQTWVKGLITLAASQELVMAKLPQAPSRLGVMGLGGRVAAGAAVGCGRAVVPARPVSGR